MDIFLRGLSLHRMAEIVKLNAAVVAMIKPTAQQPLHDAREGLDHGVYLVGRYTTRHLVGMASRTFHKSSRLQGKLPGGLFLTAALAALEHLAINESLVPFPMSAGQNSTAYFTGSH